MEPVDGKHFRGAYRDFSLWIETEQLMGTADGEACADSAGAGSPLGTGTKVSGGG